ncbi:MAG: 30S ribosomal protein S9 [Chloroflexi bacterium]|nr:30S ribosomal protein S9 [Chloroflexota bacterium]
MVTSHYFYGLGRRKSAVAQVRLFPGGNGTIVVNGKPLQELFSLPSLQLTVLQPFQATETVGRFNAMVKVKGGGVHGWADAIRHGVARALLAADENLRPALRKNGLLTRDPRVKERKKYGLKRARKAPQYTKR